MNVVFVDQPLGTGFSHAEKKVSDQEMVGSDFLEFLDGFFDQHEEMRSKEIYLSGDGYAGKFIPNMARSIIHSNHNGTTDYNLRGVLLIDGLVDTMMQ
jgi:carboxypeptidase C (cathepsin A)